MPVVGKELWKEEFFMAIGHYLREFEILRCLPCKLEDFVGHQKEISPQENLVPVYKK